MCRFAQLHYPTIPEKFPLQQEVERLLDSCFWEPLLAASDVIDKLLVAGTLALKSPALKNLHMLDLCVAPNLQLSCGFTEEETLELARSVVDELRDIDELHRSCGNYIFSSTGPDSDAEALLHPQRVIARIRKQSLQPPEPERDPFQLLADILELLPNESGVSGAVTRNSLIDLLATGAVQTNEPDTAADFDEATVTWNDLLHAGALTYDRECTLRVANSEALSLVGLLARCPLCPSH
jgi:hypothetical protein